jgi:hypothetical protein
MKQQNEAQYLQSVLGVDEAEHPDDDDKGNGGGKPDAQKMIKALINTNFSGSNDEQGKAAALFKGLAFSDDPASNKFMKKLDELTSALKAEDFA